MNSKSIIYIIFSFGNGGTQRMLVNILNEIIPPNSKRIVYLYNDTSKDSIDFNLDPNIKMVQYSRKHKLKFLLRLLYLYRIVKQESPDKVFCFSIQGAYLSLIVKNLLFFKFKIIYRMVSVDTALVNSKNSLIRKIKAFFYYKVLCKKVDTIIAQTNYMANSLIKNRKYLEDKVIVINNLINKKFVEKRSKETIKINNSYIVFIGQLSNEKNIPGIIKAFNNVKNKIKEDLIIIGSGYQKKLLENIIIENQLKDRVYLFGHKKNPYKYIYNAELMILFSKYEGFPNVVIESMVCGTPVICSDFEGADEIIKNGNNGYLVQRGDIEGLARKITEVLKQDNKDIIINSTNYINNLNIQSIASYRKILL